MGNKPSTHRPPQSPPPQPEPIPPAYNYPHTYPNLNTGPAPQPNTYYSHTGSYYGNLAPQQFPVQPGMYGQTPYPYHPQPHPSQPPVPVQGTQTKTVRNPVNLKKSSVKLHPLPDRPTLLEIKFSFDASAPCRVSTFILGTEDKANGCRVFGFQPAAPPLMYKKGMGLQFPNPEGTGKHVIDVGALSPHQLLEQSGDTYPLIIRIEAISESGQKDGRTIDTLPPGAPLPAWVQAQTTYAKLVLEHDGTWEVRILSQRLWVDGTMYDLQEIYGLAGAKDAQYEDSDGSDCVICMSEKRDTMVLPCRHMCMCSECAKALQSQTRKCPICRMDISSLLNINYKQEPKASGA